MKEMVYCVARKHVLKLRIISIIFLTVLPIFIFRVLPFSHTLALLAVFCHIAGAVMTRWLFFAQAEHTVSLYYGKR